MKVICLEIHPIVGDFNSYYVANGNSFDEGFGEPDRSVGIGADEKTPSWINKETMFIVTGRSVYELD